MPQEAIPRRRALRFTDDPAADELVSANPLALLIGMVLDQQVSVEKAFHGPLELAERLGAPLSAGRIADMDPSELASIFARPPAIHRYPTSMAARVQALCRTVVDDYGGDPTALWREAREGEELLVRVKALPGFGDQKARIFVALLGKQLGVTPTGWREVSTPFGESGSRRSVADITDAQTLREVRAWKAEHKAAAKAAQKDAPKAARRPRPSG